MVTCYFAARMMAAFILLRVTAHGLQPAGFAAASQWMFLGATFNLLSVGAAQNGLVRESAGATTTRQLARTHAAGLTVWVLASGILVVLCGFGGPWTARVLLGPAAAWWMPLTLALTAAAGGPGQVWCAMLSGRGHVGISLGAQGAGLVWATTAASILAARGEVEATALAFATGPMLTTLLAALALRRAGLPRPDIKWPKMARNRAILRRLIGDGAAIAVAAAGGAAIQFGLRALYRQAFGIGALGTWLAAVRVSDLSSQLLGLAMVQMFVPRLAAMTGPADRRRLLMRCGAAGSLAAILAAGLFWTVGRPVTTALLGAGFAQSAGFITAYLLGDALRVWVVLAMNARFARRQAWHYAAIELGTLGLMAAIIIAGIFAGYRTSPQFGYVAAYAVGAMLVLAGLAASRTAPSAVSTAATA